MKKFILFTLLVGILLGQPSDIHVVCGSLSPEPLPSCLFYTAEKDGEVFLYPVDSMVCYYQLVSGDTFEDYWMYFVQMSYFSSWGVGDTVSLVFTDSCEGLVGEIDVVISDAGVDNFGICYLEEDFAVFEYGWEVINVYPFPFNTKDAIHTWGASSFIVNVYDMQGRKVSSERVDDMIYWQAEKSGVYLLQPYNIETNECLPTIKIICVEN